MAATDGTRGPLAKKVKAPVGVGGTCSPLAKTDPLGKTEAPIGATFGVEGQAPGVEGAAMLRMAAGSSQRIGWQAAKEQAI